MSVCVGVCVGRFYVFIVLHVCASTNGCRVVRVAVYMFVYSRRMRDETLTQSGNCALIRSTFRFSVFHFQGCLYKVLSSSQF